MITMTDYNLAVILCVHRRETTPFEKTRLPDVLVAEKRMNTSLVYIDTLVAEEEVALISRTHLDRPSTLDKYPGRIIRDSWTLMSDKEESLVEPTQGRHRVTPSKPPG